jgi:N-acetyl-anhydromuramyl-L-alanine amidase AmpD
MALFATSCYNNNQKDKVAYSEPTALDSLAIDLKVDTFSILSTNKLDLTVAYNEVNYGMADYRLHEPKIIVIHYTAIPGLQQTLGYFKADSLDSERTKIKKHNVLNVGIHYVIGKDGSIFNLLADSIVARHLIGFNHVALGIENVARDSTDLTSAQLESNIKLVRYLSQKYASIDYLIGHQEYNDTTLAHYDLVKINDPAYKPYPKPDPGVAFMTELRERLSVDYGLVLKK